MDTSLSTTHDDGCLDDRAWDARSDVARGGFRQPLARVFAALTLTWVILTLAPIASAQLLADVLTSTAIAAEFNPGVRFPSGSLRAVGTGTAALEARVEDQHNWTDWEVYAASGLAAGLQAGFVHQVATSFALAGYFEGSRSEKVVADETRTRIVFEGDDGERLLFIIRTPGEVVWLTARKR